MNYKNIVVEMTPFYYFSFFLNEFPIILPLLQVKKKGEGANGSLLCYLLKKE
jgi:hypothetical protein